MPALEVPSFEFARNWISDLFARLQKIRRERSTEFDHIADRFGDPEELAKYYVEPDCQQFNPADFDAETASVVREPIFSRLRSFISHTTPQGPKTLLVLSDAGMGKTSVLVMLKLTHLTSFWPPGYECVLLKLGPTSVDEIKAIANKRGTVLLLDALDEDPTAWTRVNERLKELLSCASAFKRVVITCRTQFFSGGTDPFHQRGQMQIGGFRCAVIYNSFLSDRQVVKYIDRRAAEQTDPPSWRQQAIEIVERIGYLRMRPMLLAHLDDILLAKENIWDEFSLYAALVDAWLLREQKKAFERTDTYPDQQILYQACQTLAIEMQKRDRAMVTHNEVGRHVLLEKSLAPLLGQHLGGRSLLNRTSEGDYRFSHYSIQEFLVCSYFLEGGQRYASEIRCTDQMKKFGQSWLASRKGRQVTNATLSVFDLANLDLSGYQFRLVRFNGLALGATNLERATFEDCDLSDADILRGRLSAAVFSKCDFRRTNLNGASLEDCQFTACDFSAASLLSAGLRRAGIQECAFAEAVCDSSTRFPDGFLPMENGLRVVPDKQKGER